MTQLLDPLGNPYSAQEISDMRSALIDVRDSLLGFGSAITPRMVALTNIIRVLDQLQEEAFDAEAKAQRGR